MINPGEEGYEELRAKSEPYNWCWVRDSEGQVWIPINNNEIRSFYPADMNRTEWWDPTRTVRQYAGPKNIPSRWR